MLFYKNIIRKNNFRIYLIFFEIIILCLLVLLFICNHLKELDEIGLNQFDNLKVEVELNKNDLKDIRDDVSYLGFNNYDYKKEIINALLDINNNFNLEKGEVVSGFDDCQNGEEIKINIDNYLIRECSKDIGRNMIFAKDEYEYTEDAVNFMLVAKNYEAKLKLIDYFKNKNIFYNEYTSYEQEDKMINVVKILILSLSIILIIFMIIVVYLFNVDDKYTINLLRVEGYPKNKLLFINYLIFLSIISSIYIFNLLLIILFKLFNNNIVMNFHLFIISVFKYYIIVAVLLFIMYKIIYNILYKKIYINLNNQ